MKNSIVHLHPSLFIHSDLPRSRRDAAPRGEAWLAFNFPSVFNGERGNSSGTPAWLWSCKRSSETPTRIPRSTIAPPSPVLLGSSRAHYACSFLCSGTAYAAIIPCNNGHLGLALCNPESEMWLTAVDFRLLLPSLSRFRKDFVRERRALDLLKNLHRKHCTSVINKAFFKLEICQ